MGNMSTWSLCSLHIQKRSGRCLEGPQNASIWEWWPAGPYPDIKAYDDDISEYYDKTDPLFWAIVESKTQKCQGHAILGEIDLKNRVIEAGMFITLPLQRTTAATEAFYLIGRYAFSLGFRRLAWRTNCFNLPSRRAAERYGFSMSRDLHAWLPGSLILVVSRIGRYT
jgi:RimJ/RimL family protein N-acetyltransferase